MRWEEQQRKRLTTGRLKRVSYDLAATSNNSKQSRPFSFGINSLEPSPTDPQFIMQRADELNTVQRMLDHEQTSTVMLVGGPGVGKSILAALFYRRMLLGQEVGLSSPRRLVWLTLGSYTTLPDMMAALLDRMGMKEPDLFLLKPEQQVSLLLQALRRPNDNSLIVLDQFELLLHPETHQGIAGRGALPLFLHMLQADLGASRILLTNYNALYDQQNMEETRVRSYLLSHITIPEGLALLQRRGVQGSPEELSFIWQRCTGHVFALVLFAALAHLSGISLSYLLNSSDYQPMWAGDVTLNLIAGVYYFLNPIQSAIMRALSLFVEPVPLDGIFMSAAGDNNSLPENIDRSFAAFKRELIVLVRLGLLQHSFNVVGVSCFTLHSLLRQYILEQYLDPSSSRSSSSLNVLGVSTPPNELSDNPEALRVALAAGHMQVAAYYKQVVRQQCPPREQRKGLHDVEPIIWMVRHLCLGWRWQRACDLLFEEGLHESMVQWRAWHTLIGLYTALLPPFGVLLRRDEGLIASHVGMLYGRMGEYQQSQAYFEQALAIQRQIEDRKGEATTLANQGELLRLRGEHALALHNFEHALVLLEQLPQPDATLQSILFHNLGLLYHNKKDYQRAQYYYTEAYALAYQLSRPYDKGMILTNLGILLYERGQLRDALAVLLTALQIRQSIQDQHSDPLVRFLTVLEQKMGAAAYAQVCQEAREVQPEFLSRFIPPDMRK